MKGEGSAAQIETKAPSIGEKLRKRRKEVGKTVQQVAEETGLTPGFISQIERDISSPSLASLYNVAKALNTTVASFLAQDPHLQRSIVTHAGERRTYSIGNKDRIYEIVERGFPGAELNACLTHVPPGFQSEVMAHDGEEIVYVVEGELIYEVNGIEHVLKKGDTLHFPSSLPHRTRNVSDKQATELWVGTMPIMPD